MHFLLEKDNSKSPNFELIILKDILDKNKYLHTYEILTMDDFYKEDDEDDNFLMPSKVLKNKSDFPSNYIDAIPVGNIPFVTTWLKIFHGIDKENPIEIPPVLRTDEFLKRKYSIVTADNIPRKGRYFIKDVSELKVFSYSGDLEYLYLDEMFKKKKNENDFSLRLDSNHLFQVSEIVNILSEYRVYIIDGRIENIANYNGDPLVLPDVELIKKANVLYSSQTNYPKSYSMDLMVTNKGTAILEIHNYTSLGHYCNMFGDSLAYAYRDGIDYLLKYNTPITTFSNF